MNLTTKELAAIEEQMYHEQLLVKKYKMYSENCKDPQLKQKCEQVAAQHQDHFIRLLNKLS